MVTKHRPHARRSCLRPLALFLCIGSLQPFGVLASAASATAAPAPAAPATAIATAPVAKPATAPSPEDNKPAPSPGRHLVAKVVFLGDSLTAGYGLPKEAAFPALLESRLQTVYGSTTSVINAGVSGATTASGLSRMQWQLKGQPTHLVLALGANDGLRGFKITETRKNLEAILDLAKQHNIKVLLAGMMLPPNYGEAYTRDFAALFADLAKTYHCTFMPFLLTDVATKAELNLSDGIHPNAEGHKVIAKNLWPYLEELLR